MNAFIYEAIVKRIIDGDSVVVDIDMGFDQWMVDQNIRFTDINAPEIRTSDLEEKERGYAAKNFVEDHLYIGQKVILDSTDYRSDRGKYGRIIGNIWFELDGEWKNLTQMLLESDLAEYKKY